MRGCRSGIWLLLGLLAGVPAGAGSGSFNREIRYPNRFEVRPGPNGGVVVPGQFTTRRTGAILNAEQVGIARAVSANGQEAVQLRMKDGRTLTTRTGRLVKLDDVVYRTVGWQEGRYLLVSESGPRRYLAFSGTR